MILSGNSSNASASAAAAAAAANSSTSSSSASAASASAQAEVSSSSIPPRRVNRQLIFSAELERTCATPRTLTLLDTSEDDGGPFTRTRRRRNESISGLTPFDQGGLELDQYRGGGVSFERASQQYRVQLVPSLKPDLERADLYTILRPHCEALIVAREVNRYALPGAVRYAFHCLMLTVEKVGRARKENALRNESSRISSL